MPARGNAAEQSLINRRIHLLILDFLCLRSKYGQEKRSHLSGVPEGMMGHDYGDAISVEYCCGSHDPLGHEIQGGVELGRVCRYVVAASLGLG